MPSSLFIVPPPPLPHKVRTWDGQNGAHTGKWNDHNCDTQLEPSICKMPASNSGPSAPDSQGGEPDDPVDPTGDPRAMCEIYLGTSGDTQGMGTLKPPRPFDAATTNGMCGGGDDDGNKCCSSGYVNNVLYPRFADSTHLIDPTNLKCLTAIENVMCYLCSAKQYSFLSLTQGEWTCSVCEDTGISVYENCKDEELFMSHAVGVGGTNTTAVAIAAMMESLLNGWDQGTINTKVNVHGVASAGEDPKCFLADDGAPYVKQFVFPPPDAEVFANEITHFKVQFNEQVFPGLGIGSTGAVLQIISETGAEMIMATITHADVTPTSADAKDTQPDGYMKSTTVFTGDTLDLTFNDKDTWKTAFKLVQSTFKPGKYRMRLAESSFQVRTMSRRVGRGERGGWGGAKMRHG